MNIIWVSHRDIEHPKAGGAERTIYEIGKRLSKKGYNFFWYSVGWRGCPKYTVIDGIRVLRLVNNVIGHFQIIILLKKASPDYVIDDLGHVVPWGSEIFVGTHGSVSFYHLHRMSLNGQVGLILKLVLTFIERTYPFLYKRWNFVADSVSAAQDIERIGIEKERIRVIPLGVDRKWFVNEKKAEFPKIVYFGGMRDYKRPWEVCFAMSEIVKDYPTAKLFMIGSGKALEKTRKIVHDLGISRSVIFTGRLDDNDLIREVSSSHVNVHTSVTEGFGLSIVEASACGTPTVAYRVRGVSEIVMPGKNGILVPNMSRVELRDALTRILNSNPADWTEECIKTAKQYSWDNSCKLWEDKIIEEIN